MSELKAYDIDLDYPYNDLNGSYYDKHDVDDILAAKDKEIEELKDKERRLKRALYKACANWMIDRQCAMSCFHLEARAKKFDKAIDKCRSMAERYK